MNQPSPRQPSVVKITLTLPEDFTHNLNAIAASYGRRPSRLLADTLLFRQFSFLQHARYLASLQHHVLSLHRFRKSK